MPNIFYKAKYDWDRGKREQAFTSFNNYLETELKQSVFKSRPDLFSHELMDRFELTLYALMNDKSSLIAPFGKVFADIWRLDPEQLWIGMLLDYKFLDPLKTEDFASIDIPDLDFALGDIVDALTKSVRKGILGLRYGESEYGRPVLDIEEIKKVKDPSWEPLKTILLRELPLALKECPDDFWQILVETEPDQIVIRFLHDLIINYHQHIDTAEDKWNYAISDHHPEYAKVVTDSLEKLLQSTDEKYLTEIVKYDAGYEVNDGREWLRSFAQALSRKDFSDLESFNKS